MKNNTNNTNNQSGFLSIMAGIVGLIVVSGAAYFVVQNRTVTEDPVAPTVAEELTAETDAEVEVASEQAAPGGTTRRRVEVLKSNNQGDPNANRYDFGTDASADVSVEQESSVSGDPDANKYDVADGEYYNQPDDNCDSSTGSDAYCEALDSDDDGDSIPTESVESETNPIYEQEATKAENPMYEAN